MKTPITTPCPDDSTPGIRVNFDEAALSARGLSPDDIATLRRYWSGLVNNPTKTWRDVQKEIGYSCSVMSRAFRGIYGASYSSLLKQINSHFATAETQVSAVPFIANNISNAIWAAFQYSLANRVAAAIFGPSRIGKTIAVDEFVKSPLAAGRAVKVEAPPTGGPNVFLKEVFRAFGLHERNDQTKRYDDLRRALTHRQLLIVDEAHLFLDRKPAMRNFDILKWIHNQTNSTFAIVATTRLRDEMLKSEYMFEQISGRTEGVVRLYEADKSSWLPIVQQVIPDPTPEALDIMQRLVSGRGRVGVLCGVLRLAEKLARNENTETTSTHFLKAAEIRRQMFDADFFKIKRGSKS